MWADLIAVYTIYLFGVAGGLLIADLCRIRRERKQAAEAPEPSGKPAPYPDWSEMAHLTPEGRAEYARTGRFSYASRIERPAENYASFVASLTPGQRAEFERVCREAADDPRCTLS